MLVWGNGACSTDGKSNSALLQNIASYGFIAIAEGAPTGGGSSNAQTMKAAIDWVSKVAGTGDYKNVDASKIMAAGFSCGGVEALDNINDARVDTIGVISSGLLSNTDAAKSWKKPILFVMGGTGDIAYNNVSSVLSLVLFRLRSVGLGVGKVVGGVDADLMSRPSATTRTCQPRLPCGRATFPSATAAPCSTRMAAASARPFSTGCCGP